MDLSFFTGRIERACSKKILLAILAGVFFLAMLLGILFSGTALFYDFLLNLCDRFLYYVCYGDRSVLLIFFERTAGALVLAALCMLSGMHPAACPLGIAVTVYRAYTFGGCVAVFFGAYGLPGALVSLVLFIPIHLMLDFLLLCMLSLSLQRARGFCFRRADFLELLTDFSAFAALIALIFLLEAILLLAVFHPVGNLF